jgi:hypothetical protein
VTHGCSTGFFPCKCEGVDVVDQFISFFRGRGDCYGSWTGGCIKQPLTRHHFEQHLTSGPFIGVYPLIGDKVSWGCIDIDGKDHPLDVERGIWDWPTMRVIANNLQAVFAVKQVHVHLEQTANGIHCWVFPVEPLVAAETMRRALMAGCTAIKYTPKEVNPKSLNGGKTGIGNYVRLPYPGALRRPENERFFYDSDGECIHPQDFVNTAQRTTTAALETCARLWTPPPPPQTVVNLDAGLDAQPFIPLLDGLSYGIWKDGPLPGSDRSTTLARLAHLLAERGLPANVAYAVLRSADQRWGKFHTRQDGPEQLARFIERAYE